MRGSKTEWGPGRWRLRVYVGTTDTGKPLQKSRQFRGSAREADTALRRFVTEVENGQVRNDNPTVADLLDAWLDHLQSVGKARPYTLKSYRYVIDASIKPAIGAHKVAKLTAHHLDIQYGRWLADGTSPSTVNKYHRILSAALRQAVKWEWVDRAVTALASPPAAADPELRVMDAGDVLALIRAAEADDPILATAIALAAVTGARRGELCGLRWADYDEATATITIARAVTVTGSQVHVGTTKTRRVRRLSIGPLGVEVLERRRQEQEKLASDAGTSLVADPWILSRRADGGAPCLPNGITHAFTRTARALGLPYHFHELRHWSVTTALVAGQNELTVSRRHGHANPQITMRQYGKFVRSADQLVAGAIDDALSAR